MFIEIPKVAKMAFEDLTGPRTCEVLLSHQCKSCVFLNGPSMFQWCTASCILSMWQTSQELFAPIGRGILPYCIGWVLSQCLPKTLIAGYSEWVEL